MSALRRGPLSFPQQRLWFLAQANGTSSEFNILDVVRLTGGLHVQSLAKAIDTVVERHEGLRTYFELDATSPVQVVASVCPAQLAYSDVATLSDDEKAREIDRILQKERSTPFKLRQPPLVRHSLIRVGPDEHLWIRNFHHIVTDGWSQSVFDREISKLYEAYLDGRDNPLEPLPSQYYQFAQWQRERLTDARLETAISHWRTRLAGAPSLDLPTDRPRPAVQTFDGGLYRIALQNALTDRIARVAGAHHMTPFMIVLAGLSLVLAKYQGEGDIVIGTPVASRPHRRFEGLIGFFTNLLPLRITLTSQTSLSDLLNTVRDTMLDALENQDVPFEQLIHAVKPERTTDRTPLFQVLFNFQHLAAPALELKGVTSTPVYPALSKVRYELEVHVNVVGPAMSVVWLYNRVLFDRWRIEQMGAHLERVLAQITDGRAKRVGDISLLDAEDRRGILEMQKGLSRDTSGSALLKGFDRHRALAPQQLAVVGQTHSATYEALNSRAERLAHALTSRGAGPERIVAIALERDVGLIVAFLAVIKTGAAYLPLDLEHPPNRLAWMIRDATPVCMITSTSSAAGLEVECPCLFVGADGELVDEPGIGPEKWPADWKDARRAAPDPRTLFYVMYTSGSTGVPKAVAMPRQPIENLLAWYHGTRDGGSRVLQWSSLAFDSSACEILAALDSGATLFVVPEDVRRDMGQLRRAIRTDRITSAILPVVALEQLAFHAPEEQSLQCVITTGERLRVAPAMREAFGTSIGRRLHNHYGPTETHVVTAYTFPEAVSEWPADPPIGRPIWNTDVYVLDDNLTPSPTGVAGEVYVGGTAIARGYHGRPGLTASRFVANPLSETGERMYRTGDRAAWLPNGELQFLGRVDRQLKIRGFRIEPAEIEHVLRAQPDVRDAAVMVQSNHAAGPRLVAAVILKPDAATSPSKLRQRLAGVLPAYMIPVGILIVDEMPVTPNGKIDQAAVCSRLQVAGLVESYVAPSTPVAEALASLWQEALRVERVGVLDNFFELGGHSLLAMRLALTVSRKLGRSLTVGDLFKWPTILSLTSAGGPLSDDPPLDLSHNET